MQIEFRVQQRIQESIHVPDKLGMTPGNRVMITDRREPESKSGLATFWQDYFGHTVLVRRCSSHNDEFECPASEGRLFARVPGIGYTVWHFCHRSALTPLNTPTPLNSDAQ
ncbi:MAG: hypothetical protein OXM02_01005 [Bacteroidota bacterium]|nr:hypothetical protein [Bacteroidota bacterium]MDE2833083.1 hypothetical protein [Bacteroidota bacterium]